MVDSMDIYKSLDVNIRTVMKSPDHLKTKKICKHVVKNNLIY